MEHIEMIDKLMEKAGVSRADAADALTRAGWDMLEALVILEREGKIPPLTSSVATPIRQNYSYTGAAGGNRGAGRDSFSIGSRIRQLFESALSHSLYVRREGKVLISLPVLIFIVILFAAFKVSALALLIGLFVGCRYSIEKRGEEKNGGEK